ncbi:superoxide dismutase family protein [Aliivibrio fischeri]|uniref:superoxide dismutase family protein n=1 Tax=Aliivibrio fischeri TaxID=668 RepID=UPI0012DA4ED6|nr:superoxide dismutase family protein [Aliivibrio fischeri]MUL11504.1 superoxide dismutase [Aliivibrio fischeri]MUL15425.1 superoxide dismutase [Aliivibrio fischeri]
MQKKLSCFLLLLITTPFYTLSETNYNVKIVDLITEEPIGDITISSSKFGTVFTPNLINLPSGLHGFHIHEMGSCDPKINNSGIKILAGSAGGHYDPDNTNKHGFPWTLDNHKGDLPPLYVDRYGDAVIPVLAPRLNMNEIKGRAVIIHEQGDNHSDVPEPLGGAGKRIACGIIN